MLQKVIHNVTYNKTIIIYTLMYACNNCFLQTIYEVDLRENSPGGTSVVVVQASDADLGNYGIVRYQLEDSTDRFKINEITVSSMFIYVVYLCE